MGDISPEEAFESIKARGNEEEIATVNLEFLKHVEEAYKTFWSEDMNNKAVPFSNRPRTPIWTISWISWPMLKKAIFVTPILAGHMPLSPKRVPIIVHNSGATKWLTLIHSTIHD